MEDEVADLREEVQRLALSVSGLKRQLREVLRGPSGSQAASARGGESDRSVDSFSLVSRADATGASTAALRHSGTADSSESGLQVRGGAPGSSGSLTWPEREAIAEEIGGWINRCLEGRHRGLSGREKNHLGSRIYVVVRDYPGSIYSPVKVFKSFTPCKNLCTRNGESGNAIYVGFPSEREARRAVAAAGLIWPGFVEQ